MNIKTNSLILLLFVLLIAAISVATFSGSADFNDGQVLEILRFPRIIAAIAVGGGLALAGTTIQASLSNSLADPYTLGIASAAALGNVIGAVFYSRLGVPPVLFSLLFTFAAFFGVLFFLRNRFRNSIDIILTGIVLGLFFSSVATFILVLSDPAAWGTKLGILLGSFASVGMGEAFLALLVSSVCGLFLFMHSKALDMMSVNDITAESAGLDLVKYRKRFFIVVSIITAVAVSTAGMIGFVGFLIPHALRLLGFNNHRSLLIASFLGGAALLVAADTFSRTIVSSSELPVGVLISLIGAPGFLFLLKKDLSNT